VIAGFTFLTNALPALNNSAQRFEVEYVIPKTEGSMKRTAVILMTLALAAPAGAKDDKAGEVIASARKALGGEERLNSVRTIVAKGTSRRQMGEMQVDGELEIAIALPDRYLRTQVDSTMGTTVTREEGLNGAEPLQHTATNGPGHIMIRNAPPDADPEVARRMQLRAQRAELTRLLAAWLLAPPSFAQAAITYAGEAESPDGRADVLNVKGADELAFKLFVDKTTHRPLMMSYQGRQPVVRTMTRRAGEPPPQPNPGAERAEPPAAPLVEFQVFLDDFRKVSDVWLPHRITRSVADKTVEEWELSSIRINESIPESKFTSR
jgi:hypothetical protein